MTLTAVAKLCLGTEQRWKEIFDLNPTVTDPSKVPAGTELEDSRRCAGANVAAIGAGFGAFDTLLGAYCARGRPEVPVKRRPGTIRPPIFFLPPPHLLTFPAFGAHSDAHHRKRWVAISAASPNRDGSCFRT